MKTLLSLAALVIFGGSMIGCATSKDGKCPMSKKECCVKKEKCCDKAGTDKCCKAKKKKS